jgi:hypothetical protein
MSAGCWHLLLFFQSKSQFKGRVTNNYALALRNGINFNSRLIVHVDAAALQH